jgi:N6-adenosine-specific RNA methylase IME4/ParB-like chromosome segregation protein Spo0J
MPKQPHLPKPLVRARTQLRLHPASTSVPAMAADEYEAFRADIAERGILVPLEITAAGIVLDGRHRLRAAADLGTETVPVRLVAPTDEHEHVLLAALQRRHLSPSQRAAVAVELDYYREAKVNGEQMRLANLKGEIEVATLPARGERSRELAARLAGVSPRTVQDAATVHEQDAALFEQIKRGDIPAHTAARKVRRRLRDTQLPAAPPLPNGPFELIYADPPWQLGNPDGAHAPENHYPTLPIATIANLELPAAPNALLFLWAVNCRLPQALEVVRGWGFEYKTNLVWVKQSIGLGTWARNRHELLLVGRRGSFPTADPEDRPDSVIEAARGRHSEKPASVYQLLERMYPQATKLELFARGTPRPGWAAWGNEATP